MTLPDWQLVCSGPSGARWPVSPKAKVATVNGAIALLHDRPADAYGVFEINAGKAYRAPVKKAIRQRSRVYMTNASATHAGRIADPSGITFIHKKWGPAALSHLHDDKQWKAEDPECPEYGQSVAWITSGVLMLWALCEDHQPDRIYISGLDLYPEDRRDRDYATGLTKVFDLDTGTEWRTRRRKLNERALEGLQHITRYYPDTEFIWLEYPNFALQDIRARLASPEDLERLYGGAEQ